MASPRERSSEATNSSSTVPKFASFKPKRSVNSAQGSTRSSHDRPHESRTRRPDDDPGQRKHGKQKDHTSGRNRHGAETSSRTSLQEQTVKSSTDSKLHDTTLVDLFLEDTQGDPENLVYERLHRYSVPKYHSRGKGNVLGLGRNLKLRGMIDDKGRLISSDWKNDAARGKTQSLLAVVPESELEIVVPRGAAESNLAADSKRDYIELDAFGIRKRRRTASLGSEGSDSGSDGETALHPEAVQDDHETKVTTPDCERDDRLRLHKLSETVKNNPQDVDSWLALIDYHRPNLVNAGDLRIVRDAERKAQADIRLSIYEDALSQVGQQPKREQLLLGLLSEGRKLWDSRKLASKWRQTVKENLQSSLLWLAYLDFCQTNAIIYRYEQCKDVYQEALKTIPASDSTRKEELLVYVFLRATKFIFDAGYSEQGIALWQAMLEFILLRPKGLSEDESLAKFAEFWESENARIGEEGARGWKSFDTTEVEAKRDDPISSIENNALFESWALSESVASKESVGPARTIDDVSEDDPYRIILFSDLTDFLFQLKTDTGRNNLIQAFLRFVELPPYYYDKETISWWHDQFLLADVHGGSTSMKNVSVGIGNASATTLSSTESSPSDMIHEFGIFCAVTETSCLMPKAGWLSCWPKQISQSSYMQAWSQRCLRLLVDSMPEDDQLAEYVVSYIFQTDGQVAHKYAKALLKKRPSSLRLYNTFALIEQRLGNVRVAERVWSTALSMSRTLPESEQRFAILLWKTWTWECLDQDQPSRALKLLLAIPDGHVDLEGLIENAKLDTEVFHLRVLKASRFLESRHSHSLTFNQAALLSLYTECLSLLHYLSDLQADDLRAALSVYGLLPVSSSIGLGSERASLIKNPLIAQSIARLLQHHTRTHPHSPDYRLLTSILSTLISEHPSNTILLHAYSEITKHTNLFDRLRSNTQLLISSNPSSTTTTTQPSAPPPGDSLIPDLYKIHLETQRPTYGGGTQNSIRAAFEHAVSPIDAASASTASPFLWSWYLDFELDLASKSPRTAKKRNTGKEHDFSKALTVYYRGLRALPWHKDFAMRAFVDGNLREAMGEAELRKVYEGMVERGCRIRCDISEQLEEREGDR